MEQANTLCLTFHQQRNKKTVKTTVSVLVQKVPIYYNKPSNKYLSHDTISLSLNKT
jgi:hypothetical protein